MWLLSHGRLLALFSSRLRLWLALLAGPILFLQLAFWDQFFAFPTWLYYKDFVFKNGIL